MSPRLPFEYQALQPSLDAWHREEYSTKRDSGLKLFNRGIGEQSYTDDEAFAESYAAGGWLVYSLTTISDHPWKIPAPWSIAQASRLVTAFFRLVPDRDPWRFAAWCLFTAARLGPDPFLDLKGLQVEHVPLSDGGFRVEARLGAVAFPIANVKRPLEAA